MPIRKPIPKLSHTENYPIVRFTIERESNRGPTPEPVICVVSQDGCWEVINRAIAQYNGYIQLVSDGISHKFHKVVYENYHEPLYDNYALHTCDNPICANPSHLFRGTHADNMRDAAEKGRMCRKLTPEEVQDIRKIYANRSITQKELGTIYGVTPTTIGCITRRKTWRWLNEVD